MTATYIVWDEHENLVIRDMSDKWHPRIRQFMLEQHFKPHFVYNILNIMDDEDAEEDYLAYLDHVLRNECSIVAIDEKEDIIHAVALLKWMTKKWHSWIELILLAKQTMWTSVPKLWYSMILEGCHEHPQESCDSLHVFEYYITKELQADNEFMEKFFNAICEVGRHMNMPRITYAALTKSDQDQMKNAGFQRSFHIIYAMYVTNEGQRPFAAMRSYEEQIAWLYVKHLEPVFPYYDMLVPEKSAITLKESVKTEKEGEEESRVDVDQD